MNERDAIIARLLEIGDDLLFKGSIGVMVLPQVSAEWRSLRARLREIDAEIAAAWEAEREG